MLRLRPGSSGASRSRSCPSHSSRSSMRLEGPPPRPPSARGTLAVASAGATGSCSQVRRRGNHHARVLLFSSHWSHQQALLEKADRGAGLGVVGKRVRPGAEQAAAGRLERADEAQHGVGVAVHQPRSRRRGTRSPPGLRTPSPASNTSHGAGATSARAHGLHPVDALRARCSASPRRRPQGQCHGVEGEHRRAPEQHLQRQHRAAAVVHVVGVAVVGGAERDHGLELRRPQGRHTEPAEPAPRDADHPASPRAPALLCEPAQHLPTPSCCSTGQVLVGE